MFGSGRPDGAAARSRLRAITPRWVPTEPEVTEAAASHEAAFVGAVAPTGPSPARHALPERQRPVWRLDAAAVRGLASLAMAGVAGALVVVIVGWPRGAAAPPGDAVQGAKRAPVQSVLDQPSPSASASEVVVVDVDGAVRRPGVVELPSGSRVVDAIKSAGGVLPRADTGSLNLAQVLIDGEQVVVPREGDTAAPPGPVGTTSPAPGSAPAAELVSVNTATEVELETLPGIGPVLAAAIIEWRTQNGGFTSIDQLQEVSGIGPSTFADLAPLVRL